VSVNNNTATLEFEGTGPNATHPVTNFTCRLDRIENGRIVQMEETEQTCTAIPGMLLTLAPDLCIYKSLLFFYHIFMCRD